MSPEHQHNLRRRVAQQHGLSGPEKVRLVVLPQMKRRLEPVTQARIDRFAANFEEAYYARPERDTEPRTVTALDQESLLAVCRTCRGACCKWGEDHAYLTRNNLRRLQSQLGVVDFAKLLEIYLARVPETAYADSCIYQGAEGCALPRTMRSHTCNRYICYPIRQLEQGFMRSDSAQLAVAKGESEADERVLLLKAGTTRELPDDRPY